MVGVLGVAFEIFNPGLIFPGALGIVSFLLGLYGTAQLPVTAAGIALLLIGVGLIVAEAHLPTHGILGGVGVVGMALAGLILFDTDSDEFGISPAVVIAVTLALGGLLAFAVQRAVAARREPVRTGWEELVGAVGDVRVPLAPVGQVFVEGALWRAEPAEDGAHFERGARVRVDSVEGLTLRVSQVTDQAEEE
jgi:membrane-bound serine protease (ClpP class)